MLYLRSVEDSDALRERLDRGGARRRDRGRLDRRRGRRVRAPARPRGHRHRAASRSRSSACSAPRSARSTATSTPTTACGCCSGTGVEAFEGEQRGRARPHQRRARARVRLRRRRRRRAAAHRARRRRPASTVDNGDPRRRAPADQRARRVRRRRRRQRPPPLLRRARSASSTGPTRCTRARPPPATCSATPVAYDRLPYFFSDQYDVGMEYSGFARAWDRVVFRGDPASREFIAFWLVEDRVVAGMNVNVWDVTDPIQRADPRARRRRRPAPRRSRRPARRRSSPARGGGQHEPAPGAARRRRLDLARHALARAARQRRLRGADRRLRGHRRDLEPDDLRQGDHRLRPLRRPAPRRRRLGRPRRRRSCSSRSRSTTSGRAADLLRPRLRGAATGATASSPSSARPTSPTTPQATIEQALELWGRLARPNVMIKVPGHRGRHPGDRGAHRARRQRQRHAAVLRRALRAGDRRLPRAASSAALAAGEPVDAIASVASFFVSRVDAKADALLPAGSALRGRVAIANAQRAYAPLPAPASRDDALARAARRPARTRSGRCGPAPAPRTRPTPTSSTSRS